MILPNLAHVTPVELPVVLLSFVTGVTVGIGAAWAWASRRR